AVRHWVAEATPSDLHVLGTPPAFILSQDQTLHHLGSDPESETRGPSSRRRWPDPRPTSRCALSPPLCTCHPAPFPGSPYGRPRAAATSKPVDLTIASSD